MQAWSHYWSAWEFWPALFLTWAGSPILRQPGGSLLPGGHHIGTELSGMPNRHSALQPRTSGLKRFSCLSLPAAGTPGTPGTPDACHCARPDTSSSNCWKLKTKGKKTLKAGRIKMQWGTISYGETIRQMTMDFMLETIETGGSGTTLWRYGKKRTVLCPDYGGGYTNPSQNS